MKENRLNQELNHIDILYLPFSPCLSMKELPNIIYSQQLYLQAW